EGMSGLPAGYRDVALVEPQAYGSRHMPLRACKERVHRFAQGSEPQSVIDKLRIPMRQNLGVMRRFAIEAKRFEFAVSQNEQRASGRFVCPPGFDADKTIFNQVDAPNAVCRAYGV